MKRITRRTTIPPLVLVHGMLDTSAVFDSLQRELNGRRDPLLIPDLPMRLGRTSVEEGAERLGRAIDATFGREQSLDLLGFSMGGVLVRYWIQLLGGGRRTRRFLSVGSPQQGTLTAQPWPGWLFGGIADVKRGSALLERLNADLDPLRRIECHSYYSPLDLVVLPGWRAVLPVGAVTMLPVLTHPQLMRDPEAIKPLAKELLRP
ncbi:MAG: esterase/lipase family protein [Cyanobium sp.]